MTDHFDNWDQLSPELQSLIGGFLPAETLASLRQANKAAKELVDSLLRQPNTWVAILTAANDRFEGAPAAEAADRLASKALDTCRKYLQVPAHEYPKDRTLAAQFERYDKLFNAYF